MLIEEFEWDDAKRSESRHAWVDGQGDHGVLAEYVELRNKRDRAGSHKLGGRGRSGALITVIIVPGEDGVARPVNAWSSDAEERAHARRAGI